jgi:hypothetical protein
MDTLLICLLSLDITFSQSLNDHTTRKFHYSEQHCVLQEGKLLYEITQRNTLYSDTVALTQSQLVALDKFLLSKKLYQNITIENTNHPTKDFRAYRNRIRSKITCAEQTYTHQLDGNFNSLEREIAYQNLLGLRSFLYKLIEQALYSNKN